MPAEAYANYLAWEALDIMEGLLELSIAIQTLKSEGTITVRQGATAELSTPVSMNGTEHPDDHAGSHHQGDTALCHQDSADI